MTRINVVPPSILSSKHLAAEYFELPRVLTAVENLIERNVSPSQVDIPDTYRMGKGHVKFFYNKLQYVLDRYVQLAIELEKRGTTVDEEKYNMVLSRFWQIPSEWVNDWAPSPDECYINMQRLCERHFGVEDDD